MATPAAVPDPRSAPPDPHAGRPRPGAAAAPFALVEAGPRGLVLAAVSSAAARQGVRTGQSFSDARALCPALASAPIDRAADAAVLERLARWAGRYTPVVALDGPDGLLLDLSGCAALFGGETALVADLLARLAAQGWTTRLGLADTPGAAWALARFAPARQPAAAPPGQTLAALADLPVAALRLTPATAHLLDRFGLKTIGALTRLPRAALARRFDSRQMAEAVVRRLDQALGHAEEPLTPLEPPPRYRTHAALAEPVLERPQIEHWLQRLAVGLADLLLEDQAGAQRLALTLGRVDGSVQTLHVGCTAPSRDPAHWLRLFAPQLDTVEPGFGLDTLCLSAPRTAPLAPAQTALLAPTGDSDTLAVDALIDRLRARLGTGAVRRPTPVASHIPERAERLAERADDSDWPVPEAPRPLLLLDRPEPIAAIADVPDGPPARFSWRRSEHRVVKATGPERIAPEWWRETGVVGRTRDYYCVEDQSGARFWLFRLGLYDEVAPDPPHWFLHGLAA